MIEVKKLTKSFKNNLVLNNISFSLPRYGMVFLLGDSGCGKTTLLNMEKKLEN